MFHKTEKGHSNFCSRLCLALVETWCILSCDWQKEALDDRLCSYIQYIQIVLEKTSFAALRVKFCNDTVSLSMCWGCIGSHISQKVRYADCNSICQLDWAPGTQLYGRIVCLGISLSVLIDEINPWIGEFSKVKVLLSVRFIIGLKDQKTRKGSLLLASSLELKQSDLLFSNWDLVPWVPLILRPLCSYPSLLHQISCISSLQTTNLGVSSP